jgi:hypothetical protein
MTLIDPEQEGRRLAEFYSGQMDGELEKVASQAYELTDLAREALRVEMEKRGLTPNFVEQAPVIGKEQLPPKPGDPPPPDSPEEEYSSADGELESRNMVAIRKFRDLPEALLAKGSLDSAGIECALVDENVIRLDWLWSNLMGGVKLMVDREDAAAAEEVLTQPIPEHFDVSGIGDYEQPRCPSCNSLDINFQELEPAAYLSMAVSVPIPFHRRAWRCHNCNAEWEDDEVRDDEAPDSAESNA